MLSSAVLQEDASEESDPLDDFVGPLPPKENGSLRSKGRGSYRTSKNEMDTHFAPDYNPALDVQQEEEDTIATKSTRRPVAGLMGEDNDWELALVALRDRTQFRQKNEDRLRQAGFDERTVEKWKGHAAFTGEKDANDGLDGVKWAKRGEGREWDRGKVIGRDGQVDLRAPW